MGAIVTDEGVAFRVWAPHASSVSVKGDFNDWSEDANPLGTEFNGYWYGFVPGATVGQQYKFFLTNGENRFDRVDPYAREVTNSVGNAVIYDHGAYDWEGDDFACPPHNELVIYETHVGSFVDTDGVGTFHDLAANLDHLQNLGINAIQLMPVAEFAGDHSWGYNPAHIFAVESAYGGPNALKDLVKECHRRGIAVIMDVVYNHFGPSDLDLWTFDGWSQDGFGGIYFYNDDRAHTPWGSTRPNYGTGEVRQFIHDNALSWLRDYHVDGLRYDMIPYVRSVSGSGFDLPEGWSLMRWTNQEVREQFPAAITIAEDMHGHHSVTSTADDGAAFHAQWDALFVHPVREQLETPDDEHRSMAEVRDAIGSSYGDTYARVIYTESHDEVANGRARVPEQIEPGNATGWAAQKRSTLGAGLMLTSPGIPMLFQGQEFLEGGWFRDDVPLDWSKAENFRGIARLYRDLIRLRRNWFDTTRGLSGHGLNVFHCDEGSKVLAWQRWAEHGARDDVVIVANFSHLAQENYRIGFPSYGLWKLRLNSDAGIYSSIFGDFDSFDADATGHGQDGLEHSAEVSIAPYSLLVFSQDQ
jgi:1,4-alpha-glucan branching enzyme